MEKNMIEAIEALSENMPKANLYRAAEEYASAPAYDLIASGDADDFNELSEAIRQAFVCGAEWKELQLLGSAKLSGWVARDEDGNLHIFEVPPRRFSDDHTWWDRDYQCAALDKDDFPDVKWEDEPVRVKLAIIMED